MPWDLLILRSDPTEGLAAQGGYQVAQEQKFFSGWANKKENSMSRNRPQDMGDPSPVRTPARPRLEYLLSHLGKDSLN
jgi:hypothetical protein